MGRSSSHRYRLSLKPTSDECRLLADRVEREKSAESDCIISLNLTHLPFPSFVDVLSCESFNAKPPSVSQSLYQIIHSHILR